MNEAEVVLTKILIEQTAGTAANRAETAAEAAETFADAAQSAAYSLTVSGHKIVFTPPAEAEGDG